MDQRWRSFTTLFTKAAWALMLLAGTDFLFAADDVKGSAMPSPPVKATAKVPPIRLDRHGDPLPAAAVARIGTTRFRLGGNGRLLGDSADGKSLLCLLDNQVQFLDAITGKVSRRIDVPRFQHWGPQADGATSADGKTFAFFRSFHEGMALFDLISGHEFGTIPGSELMVQMNNGISWGNLLYGLSHDGQRLFFSGQFVDGCSLLCWFDTGTKKALHRHKSNPGANFSAAAFSPDGRILVAVEVGGGKDQLHAWDVNDGRKLYSAAVNNIQMLSFLPDGNSLVALGQPGTLRLLAAKSGKELRRFGKNTENIASFALTPDGKTLFGSTVGGVSAQVRQWDVAGGKELRHLKLPFQEAPQLKVSRDGKTLIAASTYQLSLWSTSTGAELNRGDGHTAPVGFVTFTPKGQLVSTASDPSVRLWNLATCKETRRFSPAGAGFRAFMGMPGFGWRGNDDQGLIDAMETTGVVSRDGKTLAAIWQGQVLHLWNLTKGSPLHVGKNTAGQGLSQNFHAIAFAPYGDELATGFNDGQVSVWNLKTGQKRAALVWQHFANNPNMQQNGMIASIAYSPDGRTLAAGGFFWTGQDVYPIVRVWERATREERLRIQNPIKASATASRWGRRYYSWNLMPMSLLFSPDGRMLAISSGDAIYLWDLLRGQEVRQFAVPQIFARAVALSPDGRLLAAGTFDGSIRLWNIQSGSIVAHVPAHEQTICALAFAPGGKHLVSASMDSTLLVWDVARLEKEGVAGPRGLPDPEGLWADLGLRDPPRAYRAVGNLVSSPDQAVPLLKSRLLPIPVPDVKRLHKNLIDLGDAKYSVRERAMRALFDIDTLARPALQDLLRKQPSLEARRRAESLLKEFDAPVRSPQLLRSFRAIEALERIGTPDARSILESLAQGAAGHRVTLEAREALGRMHGGK